MTDHDFESTHERPTAEQVEYFAREMRTRAWSVHVFAPLQRLARRVAGRLNPSANHGRAVDEDGLPDAAAPR